MCHLQVWLRAGGMIPIVDLIIGILWLKLKWIFGGLIIFSGGLGIREGIGLEKHKTEKLNIVAI